MLTEVLFGVTTAMLTAFKDDGSPNTAAQKELANFLIEKGVDCLYPLGTTGEMFRMNVQEREEIAEAVVSASGKRRIVYIHVGSAYTPEAVRLSRHAEKIGANGIAAVNPYYYHVLEKDIEQYYRDIAVSVSPDFPVYVYNLPQCTTMDLSVSLVKRVTSQNPNIIGIKYSLGDLARTQEYLDLGIHVMQGADILYLSSLAMGCDGTVSGTSSVYPEFFVGIKRNWEAGNIDNCRLLEKIMRKYHRAIRASSSLSHCKEALRYRGVVDLGSARLPAQGLDRADKETMHNELRELDKEYFHLIEDLCKI